MRHCCLLLVLCALPALADPPKLDDNAIRLKVVALIKKLDHEKATERYKAEDALVRLRKHAREPLEALIGPPDASPAPEPTAEQKATIAELIDALGARRYRAREDATEALLKLGKVATKALRDALKDEDPERKRRARAILDRLYPPRKIGKSARRSRAIAARLLGQFGDPRSEKALGYLMANSQDPDTASNAALALRALRRGGPTTDPLKYLTKAQREARAKEWKTFLASDGVALGTEAVELKAASEKGARSTLSLTCKLVWSVDLKSLLEGAGAPAGVPLKMGATTTTTAKFRATLAGVAPQQLALDCTKYESKTVNAGGPAMPAAMPGMKGTDAKWKGQELALNDGPKGPRITVGGKVSPAATNSRQLLQAALLIAAILPARAAGKYEPGKARTLPKGFVDALRAGLYEGAPFQTKLRRSLARLTYLRPAKVQGHARFFLELTTIREGQNSMFGNVARPAFAGPVTIDLARGRVVALSLTGPVHGLDPLRSRGAVFAGGQTKRPNMRTYVELTLSRGPDAKAPVVTDAPKSDDAPKKDD